MSAAAPVSPAATDDFAGLLVRWQRSHGRHGLPWQGTRDAYRVWLSEVMLQQTQVVTVLGYYARFLQRFPDVQALADASEDEVLGLWSGLGYYSRARNLHRCAQIVAREHGGRFPPDARTLATLPGIGPSTAAAIAAFCFGERISIFDGNVQRVLSRISAYDGDLSSSRALAALRDLADAVLPADSADMPAYTQGLMDLGATVCTPRDPQCGVCPMRGACRAHASGEPQRWPVKTRRLLRRQDTLWLLWARRTDGASSAHHAVWLQRRPPRGIWAALWCPPVFDSEAALLQAVPAAVQPHPLQWLTPVRHALTHRDLVLHGVWVDWPANAPDPGDGTAGRWVPATDWPTFGLPVPVRRVLMPA